ncbi:hypothetical protein D3C72_1290910 [compost metagenome]
MARQETVAFKPVEQARDSAARHAGPFGQFVRRKSVLHVAQQGQQHKFPFRQAMPAQARGTIAIDGGRQTQHFKTQAQALRGLHHVETAGAALHVTEQGRVFLFEFYHMAQYNMAPY